MNVCIQTQYNQSNPHRWNLWLQQEGYRRFFSYSLTVKKRILVILIESK